jgi:nucleotide-binding universal stress UspA family protein
MKSILTHIGEDSGLETRMQAALDIARATQGHLTGIYATPISSFVGFDPVGGSFAPQSIIDALSDIEARTRSKIESQLAGDNVSWSYLSLTDQVSSGLITYGALNDLIVLSRPCENDRKVPPSAMTANVLTGASAPVLVMPEGKIGFDVQGAAAIAWNGTFEASNALRAALPLLRRSKSVSLISVEEDKEGGFPQTTASEYLARHGVKSELIVVPFSSVSVEKALLSTVSGCRADYLVMGAFGHSRAREFWLGGVTRSLLQCAPLPIVFGR